MSSKAPERSPLRPLDNQPVRRESEFSFQAAEPDEESKENFPDFASIKSACFQSLARLGSDDNADTSFDEDDDEDEWTSESEDSSDEESLSPDGFMTQFQLPPSDCESISAPASQPAATPPSVANSNTAMTIDGNTTLVLKYCEATQSWIFPMGQPVTFAPIPFTVTVELPPPTPLPVEPVEPSNSVAISVPMETSSVDGSSVNAEANNNAVVADAIVEPKYDDDLPPLEDVSPLPNDVTANLSQIDWADDPVAPVITAMDAMDVDSDSHSIVSDHNGGQVADGQVDAELDVAIAELLTDASGALLREKDFADFCDAIPSEKLLGTIRRLTWTQRDRKQFRGRIGEIRAKLNPHLSEKQELHDRLTFQ